MLQSLLMSSSMPPAQRADRGDRAVDEHQRPVGPLADPGAGDEGVVPDAEPRGEVAVAYIACQELRHLYAAPDIDRARRRLHTLYQACAAPGVPELERLGRTISGAWTR